MKVLTNTGGLAATCCYVIADETAGEAVLIDAPDHTAGPLLDEVKRLGWKLTGLWLTHGHFDHIADHPLVPAGPVWIHPLDADKLRDPATQLAAFSARSGFRVPLQIPPREPDEVLEDGQVLRVGNLEATVIHTPGHAPGHVGFFFENQQILIGGDLIIGGAVGRTDLPDSDPAALDASIRRVMQLPPETTLLPGHGTPSTLGQERETNPYVQAALGA